MELILLLILFAIISLPGAPLSIPLLFVLFRGYKSNGTSGGLGAAVMISAGCGIIGWLLIGVAVLVKHLAG